jgi:hypothetical protein
MYDSTEYWHDLFTRAGGSLDLPEIWTIVTFFPPFIFV